MRTSQVAKAATALALSLLLTVTGCTSQVSGTAKRDPATAPLAVTKDKFGIAAGFDDAPVRLEIYTEPQCNHCADLQADFGDQLKYYIGIGQLQVTYRPLTFFDTGLQRLFRPGQQRPVPRGGRGRGRRRGATGHGNAVPEVRRGALVPPGARWNGPKR